MKKVKIIFVNIISIILVFTFSTHACANSIAPSYTSLENITLEECNTMFNLKDLSEIELKEICDRINGVEGLVHDDAFCLTTANAIVEYYYDKYSKQKTSIPDYLSSAYNTIKNNEEMRVSTYSYRSAQYIISNSGRFRVYYNNAASYSNLTALARLTGNILDALYNKYCIVNGFPDPIGTTNDGYYNVDIIPENELGNSGVTSHPIASAPEKTHISISQDQLVNHYTNINNSVIGVLAHEFMHAILSAADIFSSQSLESASLHEAMARAVGIETNPNYANRYNVCSDISSFILQLDSSIGDINTSVFINGSAVFYLSIFEEYGDWEVMSTMVNNYDFDYSVLTNLNYTLNNSFSDSIGNRYEKFIIYAVDPDYYFESSPNNNQNDLVNPAYSWGSPNPTYQIIVSSANETTISPSASLPHLACHYIKISANNTSIKRITVTVYYTIPNASNAESYGACIIHNSLTDSYTVNSGIVYDDELYTSFSMCISGNDVAYIAIANGGLYDELTYSCTISVSNQ